MRWCLKCAPDERAKAQDLVNHPWLVSNLEKRKGGVDEAAKLSIGTGMKQYHQSNSLKQVFLRFVAEQRSR